MLPLIVANRHARRVVGVDVGRHQVRVDVQPGGCRLGATARLVARLVPHLVFELRHPVQPAEPRNAVENPRQPGVRGDGGLLEQDAAVVDAAGQQRGGQLPGCRRQRRRVLPNRDGVQVHHAEDAVMIGLQRHPVPHRAQVVAKGWHARWLDAGKDALHGSVVLAAPCLVKPAMRPAVAVKVHCQTVSQAICCRRGTDSSGYKRADPGHRG